jgi:hypothetical protein
VCISLFLYVASVARQRGKSRKKNDQEAEENEETEDLVKGKSKQNRLGSGQMRRR